MYNKIVPLKSKLECYPFPRGRKPFVRTTGKGMNFVNHAGLRLGRGLHFIPFCLSVVRKAERTLISQPLFYWGRKEFRHGTVKHRISFRPLALYVSFNCVSLHCPGYVALS